MWHEQVYCSKEKVVLKLGKSVIAVGTRCPDVHANELVVRGLCTVTWNNDRCRIVRHMCLHLMVMDREVAYIGKTVYT